VSGGGGCCVPCLCPGPSALRAAAAAGRLFAVAFSFFLRRRQQNTRHDAFAPLPPPHTTRPTTPKPPQKPNQTKTKTAEYQFNFPDPGNLAPPVIAASGVSFSYAGKGAPASTRIFADLDISVDLDTRVAVVGPNGIGKSTLLNLICGQLEPTEGHIARNPGVRVAVFSQHHVDGLDLALTPVEVMLRAYAPALKEQEARAHLGGFGVGGTLALQPLYTLSGGQKSRVALAKLTYSKPHILLLDEPTNHLDMESIDALVAGLATFPGGVVAVSHDAHFLSAAVDAFWCVEGLESGGTRTVRPFGGTFAEYRSRVQRMRARAQQQQVVAAAAATAAAVGAGAGGK